jgi:carbamoyl-phosphate synthase large subunit
MGVDRDYYHALFKAFIASGLSMPTGGNVLVAAGDRDRDDCIIIASRFLKLGFNLIVAEDTYKYLSEAGINTTCATGDSLLDYIKGDTVALVISTPTKGGISGKLGFNIRRTSMEYNTPCLSSLDTTNAVLDVLEHMAGEKDAGIYALDEYSVQTANTK